MENKLSKSFFRRASDAEERSDEQTPETQERRPLTRRPYERRPMGSREDDKPRSFRPRDDREDDRRGNRDDKPRSFRSRDDRDDRDDRGNRDDKPRSFRPRGDRDDKPRSFRGDRDDRGNRDRYSDRGNRPDRGDRRPYDRRGEAEGDEKLPENIIFGIHPVREAIEAGTAIEKIYIRRSGDEYGRGDRSDSFSGSSLDALREQIAEASIHMQEVPVEKLNRLARNGTHQGVVAVTAAIEYKEIHTLVEELTAAVAAGEAPIVVLLDSVTDIRNFGAIARSAECAGAAALVIPTKSAAPVNAEAIKSSAGALNLIPVSRVGSLKNTLLMLREAGMQLVAATEKSNTLVFEADLTRPTVLIMGAEDRGISRDILQLCDQEVGIPLTGRIESLNVSAAAAVLLFEAVRQRFNQQ